MVGVVVVSSNPQKANKVQELLIRYYPSQNQQHLYVNNKYFSCDVDLKTIDYKQLQEIAQEQIKIDCLIIIVEGGELDQIASDIKGIIEKVDPISQVLVLDAVEENIDLEKFYDTSDCFIETVTFSIEDQYKQGKKELPKSITEDVDGILRLVQILDSTSWRNATKPAPKVVQQKTNTQPIQPIQPNIYQQGLDIKLEQDMNKFALLMQQMLSLKNNQTLPDSQRKQKAADFIMQLAMSMQDEDQNDPQIQ